MSRLHWESRRAAASSHNWGTGLWETGAEPAIDQTAAELGVRWSKQRDLAERLLNAVLILTLDHELNISSFTARVVASAGSNLYEVVNAAMCAFSGSRHGRVSVRTEQFVRALESGQSARAVIHARLSAGEEVPGFGHPLYPGGDPRAKLIMQLLWKEFPAEFAKIKKKDRGFRARAQQIGQRGSGAGGRGQSLDLPAHSGFYLFALGRTVGWIAHAAEQHKSAAFIRPRARYVGEIPKR